MDPRQGGVLKVGTPVRVVSPGLDPRQGGFPEGWTPVRVVSPGLAPSQGGFPEGWTPGRAVSPGLAPRQGGVPKVGTPVRVVSPGLDPRQGVFPRLGPRSGRFPPWQVRTLAACGLTYREAVEAVGERFPQLDVVAPLTLIVEAVDPANTTGKQR